MIEAELHGKVASDLQDDEDLLTSAVFGLLQYVPPRIFWPILLTRAKSSKGKSFLERCEELGVIIAEYEKVNVHFWPVHEEFGEPDLLIVFSGGSQLALRFIIEAKLWANKSGRGEQDQLNRYLAAMKDAEWLNRVTETHLSSGLLPGLIYLTPRSAWLELHDSIEHAPDYLAAQSELFLLQWQDVLDVSQLCFPEAHEPQCTMLSKIADFLERRGLQYFRGFDHSVPDDFSEKEASFYSAEAAWFSGFAEVVLEAPSPAEASFYASERVGSFHGFAEGPVEKVEATDVIFYGGKQ